MLVFNALASIQGSRFFKGDLKSIYAVLQGDMRQRHEQGNVEKPLQLSENDNPAAGIKTGKADQRRPFTQGERKAIAGAAEKYYPWMMPIIQFASTMPIRP
jgi:hypothetical protein